MGLAEVQWDIERTLIFRPCLEFPLRKSVSTLCPIVSVALPRVSPRSFLLAQSVKSLPAMWETQVQSLGWEELLEKEMATHSSILAWEIPWTEEPDRLQFMRSRRVGHN